MGTPRYHFTRAAAASMLAVAAFCAGGCWQEIEYTGPDPSKVARRDRPRPTETDAAAETEPSDSAASRAVEREPSQPNEPEPPTVAIARRPTSDDSSFLDDEDPASHDEPLADEPLADEEPDLFPPDETELASEPPVEPPAAAANTAVARQAAWQLGSKLTLAALAHDRGLVPEDVTNWFAEARAAAEQLGTTVSELPEPAAAGEADGGTRRVHDYLFQQGQRIHRELSERYGADHAALFEVAVKSNVLLVLYAPGSSVVEPLAGSIRTAGEQGELPSEFWQPLLDTMADQSPPAAVRLAVSQMHTNVERYLAGNAK